ncbi:cell wall-binding repeat-containing protein [Herbiconiux sp. P15]|uniref:cell wall-binding repeat-containing protein n=1 Tax=Herbiconiux liukaitaii TaxID=3342799 RepID=UPI0035B7DE45
MSHHHRTPPRGRTAPTSTAPKRSAVSAVRRAALVVGAVVALVGASVAPATAQALSPAANVAASTPSVDGGAVPVVMGEYDARSYGVEAAAIPAELASALEDDLGVAPAEYLARADAAAAAVDVVDGLEAAGVEVVGSRLDGTSLVVNLPEGASAETVQAVEAVNATVELGDPPPFEQTEPAQFLADAQPQPQVDQTVADPAAGAGALAAGPQALVGGQGYAYADGASLYLCSFAFNGIDRATARPQALTAGHCNLRADRDYSRAYLMPQSKPNALEVGSVIGAPLRSTYSLGNELDSGRIALDTAAVTPVAAVGTWGDGANDAPVTAGTPQAVRDYSRAIVGQPICKSGRTTGWTCGTVEQVDARVNVQSGSEVFVVNSYISDMCALRGDSGGAVVSGPYAIGLISNGTFTACGESGTGTGTGTGSSTCTGPCFSGTFPMTARSGYGSVVASQTDWELSVQVAAPVVSSPAPGATVPLGSALSGTVQNGDVRHTVRITVDGSRSLTAPVQSDGTWRAALVDLPAGPHTYTATAVYASGASTSTSVSGTFSLTRPTVSRIQGADRFEVSVAVAEKAFPTPATAPVVYIATGLNYPDALSAGPAAALEGGPLLLVLPDRVPDRVAAKIASLQPERIVIVGGQASVGAEVERALGQLVPSADVERLAGADRYEASRAVVASAFPAGTVPHAYSATGSTFPDALSAGAAAGSRGEPVVLVHGTGTPSGGVDAATIDIFRTLGTTSLTLVGGRNSVSEGVQAALAGGIPATVTRIDGADRYEASLNLNRDSFASAETVYLATGQTFPDALSGGVLAAAGDAPLYVVPGDCVPRGVITDLARLGASNVVLLGGPASLTAQVAGLVPCAG